MSLLRIPANSSISSYVMEGCSDSHYLSIRQRRPMTSTSSCAGQQGSGVPDESWGGRSDSCRLLHTPEQPKGTIPPAERLSGRLRRCLGGGKRLGLRQNSQGPQVRCPTHAPLPASLQAVIPMYASAIATSMGRA